MCEDIWILQIMVLTYNSVVHIPTTIELFQTVYSWTPESILCVLEAIFKNECGHTVLLYTLCPASCFLCNGNHLGSTLWT